MVILSLQLLKIRYIALRLNKEKSFIIKLNQNLVAPSPLHCVSRGTAGLPDTLSLRSSYRDRLLALPSQKSRNGLQLLLLRQGSNLNFSDPESDVLPITPRSNFKVANIENFLKL
jgi:hypothetical protein